MALTKHGESLQATPQEVEISNLIFQAIIYGFELSSEGHLLEEHPLFAIYNHPQDPNSDSMEDHPWYGQIKTISNCFAFDPNIAKESRSGEPTRIAYFATDTWEDLETYPYSKIPAYFSGMPAISAKVRDDDGKKFIELRANHSAGTDFHRSVLTDGVYSIQIYEDQTIRTRRKGMAQLPFDLQTDRVIEVPLSSTQLTELEAIAHGMGQKLESHRARQSLR